MFQPNVFRLCVSTKKNSGFDCLHNLVNVTLQQQNNGDKNMMWGITKSGKCVYIQFKAGDYVVFGHSRVGGFKYRATIVSTEVGNMIVPDWDTPEKFIHKFIITDIREIDTIECSRFGDTGRQSYTKVEGELAQEIIGL
ncbi:hypothetical protein PBCVNEJV4_515R [Paramecium bursaria Chlorella virus NE-JV-4]|nr:hypothetical protein PBCVNEJV4_515R [Paramecium bursaria Chlorella virus NE-JV-4]